MIIAFIGGALLGTFFGIFLTCAIVLIRINNDK